MKNKSFKKLLFIPTLLLTACGESGYVKVTKVKDYIYQIDTYKELDYDFASDYFLTHYDNWGGGCSAVTKMIDGHNIVGRNMDLNISNKCAYVITTETPNKHKTFGLTYTFREYSPDFSEVSTKGLCEEFYKLAPFLRDDVMNDAGLFIEVNMRHGEQYEDGTDRYSFSGTNPSASVKKFNFELANYIGENCSNIPEALELIANTNVYSQKGYWTYCFIMADAEGNSGLLEFAKNEFRWMPDKKCQTNFYVNEEWNAESVTKTGLGRYETLVNNIDNVKSKKEMFELMDKVAYSHFYSPIDCYYNHFDPRSELINDIDGLTYEFCMREENAESIIRLLDALYADIRNMSRQVKRDANEYWESTFTEVIDCNLKEIQVRFYEDNESMYRLTFDGLEKITEIK